MPLRLTRLFIIFGFILSFFVVAAPPAYADPLGEDITGNLKKLWQSVSCATDLDCWVDQAATGAVNYGFRVIVGEDADGLAASEEGLNTGLLAAVGALGDQTYNSPPDIHLAGYFQRELSNNLLSSPTYATAGTEMLGDIFEIWQEMRNVAYALFVIIVGAIALMIILQKQIAPRVVVTVTSAIPKMFTSLILITLSYPIAALFIDLFVVWLPAVIGKMAFAKISPKIPPVEAVQGGIRAFGDLGLRILLAILKIFVVPGETLKTFVLLVFVVLFLIAAIAVIGVLVLQLLYRYARILIMTIFAPFYLLFGALPGQEGAISGWFKDLAVNTLIFPAVLLLVYVSCNLLGAAIAKEAAHLTAWPEDLRELLPIWSDVVLGIVALIVLLMSIKIPGIIENAVKGKR